MKIAILLKSGPGEDNAERALQTALDMLEQGHRVSLFLLQEAVRLCVPGTRPDRTMNIKKLIDMNLEVHVLDDDAKLRGIDTVSKNLGVLEGSYDSLVALMESSEQVVGIL